MKHKYNGAMDSFISDVEKKTTVVNRHENIFLLCAITLYIV